MKEKDQEYNRNLKKSIYEFYLSNRELCSKQYNMSEREDLNTIYETIQNEDEIYLLYAKVSIIILTANKYEKNVLHTNWNSETNKKIIRIPIKLFPQRESHKSTYAYYFCWQGHNILHIESMVTGSYTIGGSADIVRYVIENPFLNPVAFISFGICFGVDEIGQTLGDVIISEKVYPYFMGAKYGEKNYIVSDNNMFRLNDNLYSRIKSEILDSNVLKRLKFKADFGNYITGEAVISNKMIREQFVGITTQTISAGDMEGYGLFKECCSRNFVIPCVIIKAICDWAVLKNLYDLYLFQEICSENVDIEEVKSIKDRLQAYATFNAYSVLEKILKQKIFNPPIYMILEEKIQRETHEKVIYLERITHMIKQISGDNYGIDLSNESILAICQVMVEDGVLSEMKKDKNKDTNTWKVNKNRRS